MNSIVQNLQTQIASAANFSHQVGMEVYKNTHSGVNAYEFGKDYTITRFGNQYYLYSNRITGTKNLERMKELAVTGKGLSFL